MAGRVVINTNVPPATSSLGSGAGSDVPVVKTKSKKRIKRDLLKQQSVRDLKRGG